jgi:hypothetical protein
LAFDEQPVTHCAVNVNWMTLFLLQLRVFAVGYFFLRPHRRYHTRTPILYAAYSLPMLDAPETNKAFAAGSSSAVPSGKMALMNRR